MEHDRLVRAVELPGGVRARAVDPGDREARSAARARRPGRENRPAPREAESAVGRVGYLGWRERSGPTIRRRPRRESAEPVERSGSPALVSRLTYLVIALYALTFASVSLLQHDAFRTNAFDLGNLDQAVWNTFQGRWFEFTNWSGGTTRLAAHVEPILLPISLLYWLWNSPKTLLILQSIVIALGALPAFWLARRKLQNEFAGFAFAAAYLLAPELQSANLRDFHPVALAPALLLFAFYFADRGRWIGCFLAAILAMATKEEIPLSIGLLGLYLVFVRRQRRPGWLLAGLAAVWFVVAVAVVLPIFSAGTGSPYFSRYNQLGEGPSGILMALVSRPGDVLAGVLIPDKIAYLRGLLGPVLFLSLLSPLTFALGLPDLALNVLSNYEWMYRGGAHYSAAIVPFIVISAIYGTSRLAGLTAGFLAPLLGRAAGGRTRRNRLALGLVYALSVFVLVASLKSYVETTLLPLSDDFPRVTDHERIGAEIVEQIPPDAPVATSSAVNPHLTHRTQIGLFPEFVDRARFIALDVTADPYPIDGPSQWWRTKQLIDSGGWGIFSARDGFLVLERGNPRTDLPPEFYSFTELGLDVPKIEQPRSAVFDRSIEFLGYDLHPGTTLHARDPRARFSLYFRALRPLSDDYRLNLTVTDRAGTPAGQVLYHPATTWLPPNRWRPGTIYRVDVAGVSPYGLREAVVWAGLDRGPAAAPDRATIAGEAGATIDPVRQFIQLAVLVHD